MLEAALLCALATAAWFAAKSFERAGHISALKGLLDAEREEKKLWATKALTKEGLGQFKETVTKEKTETLDVSPRVVTRQQMEARQTPVTSPVTTHSVGVNHTILERAAHIYGE